MMVVTALYADTQQILACSLLIVVCVFHVPCHLQAPRVVVVNRLININK